MNPTEENGGAIRFPAEGREHEQGGLHRHFSAEMKSQGSLGGDGKRYRFQHPLENLKGGRDHEAKRITSRAETIRVVSGILANFGPI
jgi:hypothetical protein